MTRQDASGRDRQAGIGGREARRALPPTGAAPCLAHHAARLSALAPAPCIGGGPARRGLSRLARGLPLARRAALLAALALAPVSGSAATPDPGVIDGAVLESETRVVPGSYALPTGPWRDGDLPALRTEGAVIRQSWRVPGGALTTLGLLAPLRDQLTDGGYDILFECETESCGGFDFRFSTFVVAAPAMYVDLGDFRFLSARKDGAEGAPPAYASVLVSRNSRAGFAQVIHVGDPATAPGSADPAAPDSQRDAALGPAAGTATAAADVPPPDDPEDFGARLESAGRVILSDLAFEIGSAQLASGDYPSLRALADYLSGNPSVEVALVGHTDADGPLDANIALSRRRAGSVLERLVSEYGVERRRLAAEGMGFLSPVASNLTDAGREANRRVEVILSDTR